MDTILTHSHNLDADTRLPIIVSDDGQFVVLNWIRDESLHYYPLEAVEEIFGKMQTIGHAVRASSLSGVQTFEPSVHPRAWVPNS